MLFLAAVSGGHLHRLLLWSSLQHHHVTLQPATHHPSVSEERLHSGSEKITNEPSNILRKRRVCNKDATGHDKQLIRGNLIENLPCVLYVMFCMGVNPRTPHQEKCTCEGIWKKHVQKKNWSQREEINRGIGENVIICIPQATVLLRRPLSRGEGQVRILGRGHTIITSRELTSCEAAHTHIVMSRYLMWALGARQSGEITLQSYRFQCNRRHKQYVCNFCFLTWSQIWLLCSIGISSISANSWLQLNICGSVHHA